MAGKVDDFDPDDITAKNITLHGLEVRPYRTASFCIRAIIGNKDSGKVALKVICLLDSSSRIGTVLQDIEFPILAKTLPLRDFADTVIKLGDAVSFWQKDEPSELTAFLEWAIAVILARECTLHVTLLGFPHEQVELTFRYKEFEETVYLPFDELQDWFQPRLM